MTTREGFLKSGHVPRLVAALLYFDVSFMVLGAAWTARAVPVRGVPPDRYPARLARRRPAARGLVVPPPARGAGGSHRRTASGTDRPRAAVSRDARPTRPGTAARPSGSTRVRRASDEQDRRRLEFVDMPLLHALPWPADLPNAGTQTERTTSINHGNTDDRRQRKSVSARDQVAGLVVSVPVLERQIEHERTARGGYALFEARWRESGHADEDWFQAEMELRSCEGSRQISSSEQSWRGGSRGRKGNLHSERPHPVRAAPRGRGRAREGLTRAVRMPKRTVGSQTASQPSLPSRVSVTPSFRNWLSCSMTALAPRSARHDRSRRSRGTWARGAAWTGSCDRPPWREGEKTGFRRWLESQRLPAVAAAVHERRAE